MVLNKKQKQQRKQRRGTKRFTAGCGARKSKQTGVLQYGGVSPACVFDGASSADVLYRNSGANIHNTNPQASLDLDNKFMNYGGAVPLGSNILQGGAAKCGDEGLGGTGNGKSATFKQYLNGLENQYMIGGAGVVNMDNVSAPMQVNTASPLPHMGVAAMNTNAHTGADAMNTNYPMQIENMEPAPINAKNNEMQSGGGFTTDPSEYIAGRPIYKAYDDCCPPAIVNNQLVMGAPDQSVCGLGAIKGGARRRRVSASRKHKRSSKRSSKSKSKNNKSRRTAKRKNNNRRNSRRQRGGSSGDFVYSATRSTPAPMSDAFNGPQGIFRYPDDMMSRSFGEVQPNYSVNAI